jgi:hypothetical protein
LDLDADHDDTPLRFRAIDAVIPAGSTTPGLVPRVLDGLLHFTSVEELAMATVVEREPGWRAAMTEEMNAITDNAT